MMQQDFRVPLSLLSRDSMPGRESRALSVDLEDGTLGCVSTVSAPPETELIFSALSLSTQPLHLRQLPGFAVA
jgi:hypothetical protein